MTQEKKTYYGIFPALLLLTLLCLAPRVAKELLPARPVPSGAEDAAPDRETVPEDGKTPAAETVNQGKKPVRPPVEDLEIPETLPEDPPDQSPDTHPGELLAQDPEETQTQGAENVPDENQENAPEDPPDEPLEEPDMEEYFSDALFIGDSRTVGISEYSGLNTATFFASVGLNIYQVWKVQTSVSGLGTVTLEELLEQRTFGKIHLMLGINELGYDLDTTVQTYGETVEAIRALQPEAVIYLGANLHVSKSRSDYDTVINNAAIDRFNEAIAELADGDKIRYLDVNPLFDDETGALRESSSGDGTHPYGSCYPQWAEWLFQAMREENT